MNKISRTLTGVGAIILGAVLICMSIVFTPVLLIYGIPVFIIGPFILLNKKEDEIESIKIRKK